jgi:hypothetical protein
MIEPVHKPPFRVRWIGLQVNENHVLQNYIGPRRFVPPRASRIAAAIRLAQAHDALLIGAAATNVSALAYRIVLPLGAAAELREIFHLHQNRRFRGRSHGRGDAR